MIARDPCSVHALHTSLASARVRAVIDAQFELLLQPRRACGDAGTSARSSVVMVKDIVPGGPASKNAQIRVGDIIIDIDGMDVARRTAADISHLMKVFRNTLASTPRHGVWRVEFLV